MTDTPKSVQKDVVPVSKPVEEAPRRTDGVSQLCKSIEQGISNLLDWWKLTN